MGDNLTHQNLKKLSEVIGHQFAKEQRLAKALTHASYSNLNAGLGGSNERLEFLGDRVLGLVIADILLKRYPVEEEGDIAKRHTALVRQEALVRVAEDINLGDYIAMSPGEEDTGGRQNASILSDCCEAVIAALYLDGGLEAAREFIETHWLTLMAEDLTPPKDPKTALQEWAQANNKPLPIYKEISRQGPAHEPVFEMEVQVKNINAARASGASKREAEQKAAEALLEEIYNADN